MAIFQYLLYQLSFDNLSWYLVFEATLFLWTEGKYLYDGQSTERVIMSN